MPTATQNTFRTSVRIPEAQRQQLIDLLNRRLADASDLKTQAKYAHWNVKGIAFQQLHELFDQVAANLDAHVDLIAERATALGGVAQGTARQAAANSSLGEYRLDAVTGEEHVAALAEQLAKYANAAREAIDKSASLADQATADLFTEIVRQADKDLWFLEAHLQR